MAMRAGLLLILGLGLLLSPRAVADEPAAATCIPCHKGGEQAGVAKDSVHGAFDCSLCHGSLKGHVEKNEKVVAGAALRHCKNCHAEEVKAISASVHTTGKFREESTGAVRCQLCHGSIHNLRAHGTINNLCSGCHGGRILGVQFGVLAVQLGADGKMLGSDLGSFHSSMTAHEGRKGPNCIDCHSNHGIKAAGDPTSRLALPARVKVCSECHDRASVAFASTFSHKPVDVKNQPVLAGIQFAFSLAIVFTVLMVGFLILLDAGRGFVNMLRGIPAPTWPHSDPRQPARFDVATRLQHGCIMVCFLVLVLTGWPLLASSIDPSRHLLDKLGGPNGAALIHKTAGAVMILVAVFHLGWLLRRKAAGQFTFSMKPCWSDLKDVGRFLVGRQYPPAGETRPRYDWIEKLEYWALSGGILIMAASGLIMWLSAAVVEFLPPAAIPIAHTIHSLNGVLATVLVLIWHLYNVHLKRGIFPMNWTWLTGHIRPPWSR